jgi:hypothetical protein
MKFAREQAILLLAIVTIASLGFGIVIGIILGDPVAARPDWLTPTGPTFLPTATPTAFPTPDASQIFIIVLGVDSVTAPSPQLEACWIITFKPDAPEYYLLGIPPTTTVTLTGMPPQTLREIHLVDVHNALQHLFMRDAARTLLPGINKPKAVVTFDRTSVIQAIDLLGGVTIAGQYYTGETALAAYESLPPDSAERMDWQSAILVNLLRAARDRELSPAGLVALLNLGQMWYPDYESVQALANGAPRFQPAEPPFDQEPFIPFLFETPVAP